MVTQINKKTMEKILDGRVSLSDYVVITISALNVILLRKVKASKMTERR